MSVSIGNVIVLTRRHYSPATRPSTLFLPGAEGTVCGDRDIAGRVPVRFDGYAHRCFIHPHHMRAAS